MKRITAILTLLLMATLSLTSCKKDEKDNLLGKWEATSAHAKEYLNGQLQSNNEEALNPNEKIIEFKSNSTFIFYDNSNASSSSGTYSVIDKAITLDGEIINYSINGSNLTLNYDHTTNYNGAQYREVIMIKFKKQ